MSGSSRLGVAIVGGGIAGPAAALFLARAGHDVTVFDRADTLGPRGAGILLAPTGQYVLEQLGLLRETLELGSRIQRIEGNTVSGNKILDLNYRSLGVGLFGVGIHRGSMFSILQNALDKQRVEVKTGRNVIAIRDSHIHDAAGHVDGPYDLIVIADGSRSKLRRALSLETKSKLYGYGALWFSVTNWGSQPDNVLRQTYGGTRRMAGILPSGKLQGVDGRQISLFWSLPLSDIPLWRERGVEHWKSQVVDFMPGVDDLVSQIESFEQITIAAYHDVRTWTSIKQNCVVIGDAAHASSPQLGQGASLALFDAWTLAECLNRDASVLGALLRYRVLREKHVRFYQLASKLMTPAYQSGHSYLALPRNVVLGSLSHWSWMQKQMAETMCGLKQGAFDESRKPIR